MGMFRFAAVAHEMFVGKHHRFLRSRTERGQRAMISSWRAHLRCFERSVLDLTYLCGLEGVRTMLPSQTFLEIGRAPHGLVLHPRRKMAGQSGQEGVAMCG